MCIEQSVSTITETGEEADPETVREAAARLKKEYKDVFAWEGSNDVYREMDCYETPREELIGKAKPQQIPGRGTNDLRIPFLRHFIEPMVWWFKGLRWSPVWNDNRPQGQDPRTRQVTWHELATHFEVLTGLSLAGARNSTAERWGHKAKKIKAAVWAMFRELSGSWVKYPKLPVIFSVSIGENF